MRKHKSSALTQQESDLLGKVFIVKTQVVYRAFRALGISRCANIAAVQDKPVMGVHHKFRGNALKQGTFNFKWR